ncbi:hypothetical protein acdb102_22330 [Acidothermaceae bacterium B102]|nr:hypothetical protein acdb102_22330 [Acidothermaceae bacterium B102]
MLAALVLVAGPAAADPANPFQPPSLTTGNTYDGAEAAAYATATVYQPQPFSEACAWLVSQSLWVGGLAEDDTWNEEDSHGGLLNFGQGSPIAADVNLLTNYLLARYPASYLTQMNFSTNAVPTAALGDVVIYVWDGDPNWLTDGDHNTHMALVTNIEPGAYPDVTEWGDVDEGQLGYDDPSRGWTWSNKFNEWLQQEQPSVTAYLLHIDDSTPLSY